MSLKGMAESRRREGDRAVWLKCSKSVADWTQTRGRAASPPRPCGEVRRAAARLEPWAVFRIAPSTDLARCCQFSARPRENGTQCWIPACAGMSGLCRAHRIFLRFNCQTALANAPPPVFFVEAPGRPVFFRPPPNARGWSAVRRNQWSNALRR